MKQYELMSKFDNNELDRDHEHPGDITRDCLRPDIVQPSESMGYSIKSNGIVAQKIFYMSELDEVLGPLNAIEEYEGGIVALIGKIPVYLPSELTVKLQCLIGRRVGVLRLEGYRVRAF
jgi:hypothetical protein